MGGPFALARSVLEERELGRLWPAEGVGGELRQAGELGPADRDVEELLDLIGKDAVAPEAGVEVGVVEASAAQFANAVQHLALALGKVAFEPIAEEVRHTVGEAQDDVADTQGAGIRGGLYEPGNFRVGEAGNDGCNHDADGHTRLRECLDGRKPLAGRRRPGLENAAQ